MKKIFKIQGMHCSSCAVDLEWKLEDIRVEAKCNYAKSEIEVEFDPKKNSMADIAAVITNAGYSLVA